MGLNKNRQKNKNNCINCSFNDIQFKNNPNLKSKGEININFIHFCYGLTDLFEVFKFYRDNKEYIVSPNERKNLLIISLLDNKVILSLSGHKMKIVSVRYFINNNNKNEYLVSSDWASVIIWDISQKYKLKHKIDTNSCYSTLLTFINDNNYIIIPSDNKSNFITGGKTKIYSLDNGKYIKNLGSESKRVYYLLLWNNKNNNKYYIIQFADSVIEIDNLFEKEIYAKLKSENESRHYSGCIINKEHKDYLCCSSTNGYIHIWDLHNKNIFKTIKTNNTDLSQVILWNNKYILVANEKKNSFIIIDLEIYKVITEINGKTDSHNLGIKKMIHPKFGETLLTCGNHRIRLWCCE